MSDNQENQLIGYIGLTSDIVAAYISNNSLPSTEIGKLIISVYAAIDDISKGTSAIRGQEISKATPAQIKKSIPTDALISFEDGKSYKTLRRHLTMHGLTPESYRAKHGLPNEYPMVCAGYSAQRSELAKSFGLGRSRMGTGKAVGVARSEEMVAEAPANEKPKRAGRPRKAAAE